MDRSLLEFLVDPISKTPLLLREGPCSSHEGSIIGGLLQGSDGRTYPITNRIPRFVVTEDSGQRQTERSFAYKWQQTDTYSSPTMRASAQRWMLERYGFQSVEEMREFFSGHENILDAGCGGGFSSSLWLNAEWRHAGLAQWFGVDISQAIDVAQKRLDAIPGTHFIQADLMNLPFLERSFDAIFCEGVLHHTPSTKEALKSVARCLRTGGEFLFYVYAKKSPIREFSDDYIRGIISPMSPEDAWENLRPLTRLAHNLAALGATVEVPEDIPYLGIKAGQYDVQRLLYWHFLKLFWSDQFSFEGNNHVNFDWYHPRYSHRQTEEAVRRWCEESGLVIHHFNAQESGFTVRALKAGQL